MVSGVFNPKESMMKHLCVINHFYEKRFVIDV